MKTTWNVVDWVAVLLVIVGGINWGLIGLLSFNLVESLFGNDTVTAIIYTLVGAGALYMVYSSIKVASSGTPSVSR